MYILSEQQIDFILNDIKVRGVEMEDLQLNLLDHICCIVEYELEPGGNFEHFYQKTIPRFFKKELKEIQEETTLLLTFKNYYAMKKTMNTVGIIASIGIVLGAIFKFQHWPGANVMLLLGVVLMSFIFLPLMFTLKLRESKERRDKIVLILGCVISILFMIASVFRLLHWPGSNVLLGSAVFLLLLVFLPVYLFTGLRNPVTKVNVIVNTVLILAGSGLLMSLSTNKTSSSGTRAGIVNMYLRLTQKTEDITQKNVVMYNSMKSTILPADVNTYLVVSKSAHEYIEGLKINMIMAVEGVGSEEAKKRSIDFINVTNEMIAGYVMLGPDFSGNGGSFDELEGKLSSLNTSITNLKDASKNNWNPKLTITKEDFKYLPLGLALQELGELQYEIANVNNQILNYYSAKIQ